MTAYGSVSGNKSKVAKLTRDKVVFIRENPDMSLRALAKALSVHHSTVGRVRNGETWGHVRG